jgi:hypothetical protein
MIKRGRKRVLLSGAFQMNRNRSRATSWVLLILGVGALAVAATTPPALITIADVVFGFGAIAFGVWRLRHPRRRRRNVLEQP